MRQLIDKRSDGGVTVVLGNVHLEFPPELLQRMEAMGDGGTVSFVMMSDLIARRFVECLEIDGRFYYKTDIRDALKRGVIGKAPEVTP